VHLEGPAAGHLDTGFQFSSAFKQIVPMFPSCQCMLQTRPSLCKNTKINLASGPLNYLAFQIISTFSNEKLKIPPSLSEAFTAQNLNAYTLIFYSERRAGTAWALSNKMPFLPPPHLPEIKRFSLLPKN
jgi:hypothetical protein